jgi:ABC-type lipoprotein export system ATPase subunit
LIDQKQQIVDLEAKVDDTERRFRQVTKSLVVQTTELAEERHAKRNLQAALEAVLRKERKIHKKRRRELEAVAQVKPEDINVDV